MNYRNWQLISSTDIQRLRQAWGVRRLEQAMVFLDDVIDYNGIPTYLPITTERLERLLQVVYAETA